MSAAGASPVAAASPAVGERDPIAPRKGKGEGKGKGRQRRDTSAPVSGTLPRALPPRRSGRGSAVAPRPLCAGDVCSPCCNPGSPTLGAGFNTGVSLRAVGIVDSLSSSASGASPGGVALWRGPAALRGIVSSSSPWQKIPRA